MSAADVVAGLARAGKTIAVAESLTGGALTAHLVAVPGASTVVRGGVVAYATGLKARLLGVDAELLQSTGPVDPVVAQQMADGVRARLDADIGLATTGVAGPAPQSGRPVGTVIIALTTAELSCVREHALVGTRDQLREATVLAATALLRQWW